MRAAPRHVAPRLRVPRATLADTVGRDLRILVCGLNPSLHAADAGYGFAGPGNRFWSAALQAGVVTSERDPVRALVEDHVGMTDLVKRATPRAAEISTTEYATGMERVERVVAWLEPQVVCFVGLAGWRVARDRAAQAGLQPALLADRAIYVMPSTSGLNARVTRAELVEHFRAVVALAE